MPRPAIYGTPLLYVALRLHPAVVYAADDLAAKRGVTASQVMHEILAAGLGVELPPKHENKT